MFREIHEVNEEKIRQQREEQARREREAWLNGAGQIRPENGMTLNEAKDFWNNMFM